MAEAIFECSDQGKSTRSWIKSAARAADSLAFSKVVDFVDSAIYAETGEAR